MRTAPAGGDGCGSVGPYDLVGGRLEEECRDADLFDRRVGGQADASALTPTGQVLEIVPLTDPHARGAAAGLPLQVIYRGKALPDALVKAWHHGEGQATVLRARTDAQGRVRFDLPRDGAWMVGVVHMVRASGVPDIDWDSHWANLTFEAGPAL